jgi:hypothetical protein
MSSSKYSKRLRSVRGMKFAYLAVIDDVPKTTNLQMTDSIESDIIKTVGTATHDIAFCLKTTSGKSKDAFGTEVHREARSSFSLANSSVPVNVLTMR